MDKWDSITAIVSYTCTSLLIRKTEARVSAGAFVYPLNWNKVPLRPRQNVSPSFRISHSRRLFVRAIRTNIFIIILSGLKWNHFLVCSTITSNTCTLSANDRDVTCKQAMSPSQTKNMNNSNCVVKVQVMQSKCVLRICVGSSSVKPSIIIIVS